MMKITAAVLALAFSGAAARADDFESAVDHWLAVEDAAALPLFAKLAAAGDERAMLMLDQIATNWPMSDWLVGLDRKTRNAMLRAPGGLSGKPWLLSVKDQRALADALTYTGRVDDFQARATVLFQMGETAAGKRVALTAFNQRPSSLAEIDAVVAMPGVMQHMLWYSAGFAGSLRFFGPDGVREPTVHEAELIAEAGSAEIKGSLQQRAYLTMFYPDAPSAGVSLHEFLTDTVLRMGEALASDSPQFGDPVADGVPLWPDRTKAYEAAADILMQVPELVPMRGLCEAACPDAVRDCVRTVYGETYGVASLVSLGPPLATLVPEDRYLASPRYLDDLRNMAMALEGRPTPPTYAACGLALLHP